MIVCDTGPLVAAALSNDADHTICVELDDCPYCAWMARVRVRTGSGLGLGSEQSQEHTRAAMRR